MLTLAVIIVVWFTLSVPVALATGRGLRAASACLPVPPAVAAPGRAA